MRWISFVLLLLAGAVQSDHVHPNLDSCENERTMIGDAPTLDGQLNIGSEYLDAFGKQDCNHWNGFFNKHQNANLSAVPWTAMSGPASSTSWNYRLYLYDQMLFNERSVIEFLVLDEPWIKPLEEYLLPLPLTEQERELLPDKYVHRNSKGEIIAFPLYGNQRVNFYNQKLLNKYGHKYPTSLEEFDVMCGDMFPKMRQERIDSGHPNPEKTHCMSWNIWDKDPNRFIYNIVQLLSMVNGGIVIENNGTISIDNPGTYKALSFMQKWLSEEWISDGSFTRFVVDEDFPIYQDWSSNAFLLNTLSDSMDKSNQFHYGPMWGGGMAADGTNLMAISKFTRNVDMAEKFLHYHIQTLEWIYMSKFPNVPVIHSTWRNHEKQFCNDIHMNILCEGMRTYPSSFERLVPRPSLGCGSLYLECSKLVQQYLQNNVLSLRKDAYENVRELKVHLQVLLGQLDPSILEKEYTNNGELFLIIVAPLSGLFMTGVLLYVIRGVRTLRKSKELKIPVGLLIGMVVTISVTIVIIIVLELSNKASVKIQEDMSARLRYQSIVAVRQPALVSWDLLSKDPAMSQQMKIDNTMARIKLDLSVQKIDDGALLVVFDRSRIEEHGEYRILVSTDTRLQVNGWVYSPLVAEQPKLHPWLAAYLSAFKYGNCSYLREIDTALSHRLSTQKGEILINAGNVVEDWVIAYMIPVSVVIGESTNNLETARYYGIGVSVIAVVAAVCVAVFIIMEPLIAISHDIEKARMMKFQTLSTSTSILSETAALQQGFREMAAMLQEYKAYIPKSVFVQAEETDDDTDSEVLSEPNSKGSSGDGRSVAKSSSSVGTTMLVYRTVNVGLRLRGQNDAILLTINLKPTTNPKTYTRNLSLIEILVSKHYGILHQFSTSRPFEIVISWNCAMKKGASNSSHMACRFGLDLIKADDYKCAIVLGQAYVGNMGTKTIRAFSVAGNIQKSQWAVALMAELMPRCGTLIDGYILSRVATSFRTVPWDVLRLKGRNSLVSLLIDTFDQEMGEWMYQVQELRSDVSILKDLFNDLLVSLNPKSAVMQMPQQMTTLELEIYKRIKKSVHERMVGLENQPYGVTFKNILAVQNPSKASAP